MTRFWSASRSIVLVLVALFLGGCGTMQSLGSHVGFGRGAAPADTVAAMPQAPIPAPIPAEVAPAPAPAPVAAPAFEPKRVAVAPRQRVPAKSVIARQRRSGAYFQDDGPGDVPPELLLAVPEPAPRAEPLAAHANQNYRVFGKSYQPAKVRKAVREVGLASWYGRQFHGRKTATGERYDMYAISAAHTTLPLPSFVRVTNLETNRSIVVRVNDRGPFHPGRIIDLSYAAAAKLGFAQKGSAKVAIETITPEDMQRPKLAMDVQPPKLAMDSGAGSRALPAALR